MTPKRWPAWLASSCCPVNCETNCFTMASDKWALLSTEEDAVDTLHFKYSTLASKSLNSLLDMACLQLARILSNPSCCSHLQQKWQNCHDKPLKIKRSAFVKKRFWHTFDVFRSLKGPAQTGNRVYIYISADPLFKGQCRKRRPYVSKNTFFAFPPSYKPGFLRFGTLIYSWNRCESMSQKR